jgi:hypothetical protein
MPTIAKQGHLFYVVDDQGKTIGQAYAWRKDAQARLDALLRTLQGSTRTCMNCQKPFDSSGQHNRICRHCKRRA